MREYYVLKSQSHGTDTTTHMKALSGENTEEYFKATYDEINSIIRRDIWEIVLRESIADQNVLLGTCSLKCKKKPDWTIRKFKAKYFVRGEVQRRLSTEPLNSYSTVVQWATVRLMLILQCILDLQSQSIDFANAFALENTPSGDPIFIEITRDLKSDVVQYDVVLR